LGKLVGLWRDTRGLWFRVPLPQRLSPVIVKQAGPKPGKDQELKVKKNHTFSGEIGVWDLQCCHTSECHTVFLTPLWLCCWGYGLLHCPRDSMYSAISHDYLFCLHPTRSMGPEFLCSSSKTCSLVYLGAGSTEPGNGALAISHHWLSKKVSNLSKPRDTSLFYVLVQAIPEFSLW